jgi:type IV pilus assembly protein PilX
VALRKHARRQRPGRTDQRGSALIIGLLLLLLMTLVALSTTTETRTDSRMTSNQLDRLIAFQAAEAALREAEDRLRVPNPSMGLRGDAGFYNEVAVPPSDVSSWDDTSSYVYTGNIPGIVSPPRYVIDQLPVSSNRNGYLVAGEVYHGREHFLYRVTVACTGRSGKTEVVIQATFSPPEA